MAGATKIFRKLRELLDVDSTIIDGISNATLFGFKRNGSSGKYEATTFTAGAGDALTTSNLDQFADVTQTSGKTLAITDNTTLNGGTQSGTNTGDQTSVSGNAGTATALQTSRNIDGQAFDGTANITVIAPGTHAATSKATPVDADELPLVDSAASNVLKKLTWANLKATIKAYTDTLYLVSGGALGTPSSGTLTNCDGTAASLTAGHVTTNANLTGDVTSSGNATTLANIPAIAGTNLTGTAANLTAGHVTTNANLTGPITSSGNATAIASQTGTGTKFVVDTSPTLVTPLLGTPTSGTLTNCTFPTLNQNTSGSAASLSISGQTGLLTVSGLASTNRNKVVSDAADTILELGQNYTPTGTWTAMKMTNQRVQAGSTSVAPMIFDTTGAVLTTPVAGAHEADAAGLYYTNNTTSGRGQIAEEWYYYTTGNGSASNTASITDVFPATSSFAFVLNGIYQFYAELFFTKTTSGTMIYTLTNTQNFTAAAGEWVHTPAAGISGGGATSGGTTGITAAATIALPATASLTGPTHWARIMFMVECGTAGNLRLRGTPSAGTFTLLRGSWYRVRRLPTATMGTFVA